MNNPTHYLIFNDDGSSKGVGFTPDGTIPENGLPCTQEQKDAWQYWKNVKGKLVPAKPVLSLRTQATELIAHGITIISDLVPPGTYSVAQGAHHGRDDILAELLSINSFGEFTNGKQTLDWKLKDGTNVTFPSTDVFKIFAKAALRFFSECRAVQIANAGTLPSASVTIS